MPVHSTHSIKTLELTGENRTFLVKPGFLPTLIKIELTYEAGLTIRFVRPQLDRSNCKQMHLMIYFKKLRS